MRNKCAKCAEEGCDNPVFSRGLCQKHYSRQRRHGGLERIRQSLPEKCTHPAGCDQRPVAKGLCGFHYQQDRGYLRTTWGNLRSRAQGDYPPSWDGWEAFVAEVHAAIGERPSDGHQLRRPNTSLPWGPTNMVWRDPVGVPTDDMALYQWRWNLRKQYGLEVEEVRLIIESQGGLCPACHHPLGDFAPSSRKGATVVVDHDHRPGMSKREAVRGVMHRKCNSSLGLLGDTLENCRRIVAHLEAHERRRELGITIIDEIAGGKNEDEV